LRPGTRFVCKIDRDSVILTLETRRRDRPKLILDPAMGLQVTKPPPDVKVTSEDVRAALADFP
jgi:hypothetical protein